MEELGIWLSPLLLMPGSGLLILSTSARYAQIHNEMHHLMDHVHAHSTRLKATADELLCRSILFRNALVFLYASVALLALGGLLGAITTYVLMDISVGVVISLTGAGIACLVLAAFFLIRESTHSLDIIKEHHEVICEIGDDPDHHPHHTHQ